jgi:hypothetical protein
MEMAVREIVAACGDIVLQIPQVRQKGLEQACSDKYDYAGDKDEESETSNGQTEREDE